MIDKFINKYQEFASHEGIGHLTDEAKIALFGVYLEALRPSQPSGPTQATAAPAPKSAKQIRRPHRSATDKQKKFIRTLISQGKLDGSDVDFSELTVAEASSLIDQGIKSSPKPKTKPAQVNWDSDGDEEEEEPEGEFTGSYSHASNGANSQAHFWE